MTRYLEKILEYGLIVVLFVPLIVGQALVFPLVTTKIFSFYILVDVLFCVYLFLLTKKSLYPKKNKLLYLFFFYIILGFVLNFFGINFKQSFFGNYERMVGMYTTLHLSIYLWMLLSVYNTPEKYIKLLKTSAIVGFLVGVYGILQTSGLRSWGIVVSGDIRLFSTIGNAAYLAGYILIYLFFVAYLFVKDKNKYWRVFYVTAFLLGVYTLLGTATRGALVGLAMATFLMFLYIIVFYKTNKIRLFCSAFLVLLLVASASIFIFKDSNIVKNNLALRRVSEITLQEGSTKSRLLLWKIVFVASKERPITGWGENNIRVPLDKYHDYNLEEDWFDSSHNQFLDILLAYGIVGFIVYLVFIFSLYYFLFKVRNSDFWFSTFFIGLLTAYLVQSLFIFDSFVPLFVLYTIFGFVFVTLQHSDHKIFQERVLRKFISNALIVFVIVIGSFIYLRSIPPAAKVIKAYRMVETDIDQANYLFREASNQAIYGFDVIAPAMSETAMVILKNSNKYTLSQLKEFVEVYTNVYEKAIKISNGYSKFYVNLAKIYQLARDVDDSYLNESEVALQEALFRSPNRVDTFYTLSQNYFFKGDYEKAEEVLTDALKFENTKGKTYLNLTEIQLRKGSTDEGLINLHRAIGFGKQLNIAKLESFARVLIERGEWKGVVDIFLLINDAQPNNTDNYFNIAMAYKKAGNIEKAREWVKKAEEIDPRQQAAVQEFIDGL